jgi:hypothetical protein
MPTSPAPMTKIGVVTAPQRGVSYASDSKNATTSLIAASQFSASVRP